MNSRKKDMPLTAAAPRRIAAKPLGDLASKVLSPVIARRAGMTQDLLAAWPELCGPRHAAITRPERIAWPRRASDDDPFEPGTLTVACDGAAAVLFQHETGEIIGRINRFFGFPAVAKIRIVQRPVSKISGSKPVRLRPEPVTLDEERRARLEAIVARVDNEGLKSRLEKLGSGVFARTAAQRSKR